MPRDNRCMYVAQVCFYGCCSDCVRGVMDVEISACIVTRGAVGDRVWQV